MFTKEEVFVATDGSIHREQAGAEKASFAHFMQDRMYRDEQGEDTGRFAVEAFFYQLSQKPALKAWLLAQLKEEKVRRCNCGTVTGDGQDYCSQACYYADTMPAIYDAEDSQ